MNAFRWMFIYSNRIQFDSFRLAKHKVRMPWHRLTGIPNEKIELHWDLWQNCLFHFLIAMSCTGSSWINHLTLTNDETIKRFCVGDRIEMNKTTMRKKVIMSAIQIDSKISSCFITLFYAFIFIVRHFDVSYFISYFRSFALSLDWRS